MNSTGKLALALLLLIVGCGVGAALVLRPSSIPPETQGVLTGRSAAALSCSSVPTMVQATQTFTVCGVQRTVLVAVPRLFNASLPATPYMGKHGLNGTSSSIFQKNVWYCMGNQQVQMFPQGVHQGPPQNGNGWDITPGGCDSQLTDATLAWAASTYPNLNMSKLRLYGFSMGSLQSIMETLTHHQGWVQFLGVVSGEMPWTMSPPYPDIVVTLFQDGGALDSTFPPANQEMVRDTFITNDGGHTATSPGYDGTFLWYNSPLIPAPGLEWGLNPSQGHGWYSDTTPAMDDALQRTVGL